MTWDDAFEFIKKLNKQRYAGYSDWRLPTKEELKTLIDFGKTQGYSEGFYTFFNRIGFKNVQSADYWSATTEESWSWPYVWYVDFRNGDVGYYLKTYSTYILPVRSGQ